MHRRLSHGSSLLATKWRDVLLGDPCAYCFGRSETMEHVTPISRGGKAGSDNKVGACRTCNEAKASMGPVLFLIQRGVLGRRTAAEKRARTAQILGRLKARKMREVSA